MTEFSEDDSLDDVRRFVKEKRARLVRQIEKLDNFLDSMDTDGPRPVIAGQFKGMRVGPALEAYIKARPGHRIPYERAAEDLYIGGAAIGDRGNGASGRLHTLKITLPNKRKIVNFNEEERVLWLADTAGDPLPKRNQKKKPEIY